MSVLFLAALLVITNTSQVSASTDIDGPTIIHKEANQVFTIMDLLSLYDVDVFATLDEYTGNGNIPGEYSITLSQGMTSKEVTIVVIENWSDLQRSNDLLFVADYKDIYVTNERNLTLYEIIYYIYSTTGYVITDYQFRYEEILDEYHTSFIEGLIPEGSYSFNFRLTYFTGEQATFYTTIHTKEFQEMPGIVIEPPPTQLDQIMSYFPVLIVVAIVIYLFSNRKKKRGYSQW